jgi:glycosyltransferase involved in cell wall biosynthesis
MATRTPTILYVQPVSERGGSDHALLRLVRSLPSGVSAHLAVPAEPPLRTEYEAAGATVHVVPMRRLTTSADLSWWVRYAFGWPVAVVRLWWLGRRVGVDVVHTNSLHSWYGWAAALLLRRPHVWHAREVVTQSGLALRVERLLTRRFATLVVAASETVAGQLPGAKVEVVLDDADRSAFRPGRAGAFRAGSGIGDGVPLVVAASRLDTWKGVEVALDAWPEVRAARPDAVLAVAGGVVAGKEAFAHGLRQRARSLGGVVWLAERPDVADLVADADVLVALSTTAEPWGLSVVEALACGVPVVATGLGGHLEILHLAAPGAGRVVPPADPSATAAAVLDLLPPTMSTVLRRARPVLLPPLPDPAWGDRYARLLDRSRQLSPEPPAPKAPPQLPGQKPQS